MENEPHSLKQQSAVEKLKNCRSEEALWQAVEAFQNHIFYTSSGLPFRYTIKIGRNGEPTKELWIDRRENSKSLSWSSIVLAFKSALSMTEKVVSGPKSLGNIRGVSYIYPIFWSFGLINVPEQIAQKMKNSSFEVSEEE